MSITLGDMTAARYDAYLARVLPAYAAEGARSTGMDTDAAMAKARAQFDRLLPEGLETPGQHFRDLVTASGEIVGLLWYAEEMTKTPPRVFIYDIEVDDGRRGQGLGSMALTRLEEEARALGAREVALHVFEHNEGAIRLYERLGYESTLVRGGGRQMAKRLE